MSRVAFGAAAFALVAALALVFSGGTAAREEAKPAAASAAEKPANGPRLDIVPEAFDFGQALPNITRHKPFTIRNTGTSDLVIDQVSTSCGCTAAFIDGKQPGGKAVIKPGSSATLNVSLQLPGSAGRVQKSVLIKSNDSAHPVTEVKVEATVVAGAGATR